MITSFIGGAVCIVALVVVLHKSLTFDPKFDEIDNSPYMVHNKGKSFKLTSCSEPVPMSISRSKDGYRFDYSIKF